MKLKGKTALVTGGAQRVGRAIALRLAQEGLNVAFSFHSSAGDAARTSTEIAASGVRAVAISADLTRLDHCEFLVKAAESHFPTVDVFVHNASQFPRTPLAELAADPDEFARVFDAQSRLHMQAALWLGARIGLAMKRRGWGRIVHVCDQIVHRTQAYPNYSVYLATKYGLLGASQALAAELAPEVQVNTVAPGLVIPPEGTDEKTAEILKSRNLLLSQAGPQEIAEDVVFLVKSNFKTGSILVSDGGASLKGFSSG
ncbi:MAG TPA: SDR family oxidoreductase [Acidobacteriota bacterium]|nr:SDR family oxidoreductase [Acidobacteriota bacterium]